MWRWLIFPSRCAWQLPRLSCNLMMKKLRKDGENSMVSPAEPWRIEELFWFDGGSCKCSLELTSDVFMLVEHLLRVETPVTDRVANNLIDKLLLPQIKSMNGDALREMVNALPRRIRGLLKGYLRTRAKHSSPTWTCRMSASSSPRQWAMELWATKKPLKWLNCCRSVSGSTGFWGFMPMKLLQISTSTAKVDSTKWSWIRRINQ